MITIGFDTSNYTTSVAYFDGETGVNYGRLLPVPEGTLGLRQSDALFAHMKQVGPLWEALCRDIRGRPVRAVAASTRPRAVEGSYMPCFLAGETLGRAVADALGVPFFPASHQQGHLAAAAWSSGALDLLDRPFLSWHLSGGTTELLLVSPDGPLPGARCIGGTSDLAAGQLLDRAGRLLGVPFPAGRVLDQWSRTPAAEAAPAAFSLQVEQSVFSLSGMENKVKAMVADGASREAVSRFAIDTVAHGVKRATEQALEKYPGLPVLFAGGVSASLRLREVLAPLNGRFAEPRYAADNAMGAAILAHRHK